MALWEYKVITSGPHGFASPALLEAHLNALGKDEWEIIHFQTLPNNSLAFNGLARRSTMRDWVPPVETAAASPAKPPVEVAPIATKAPVARAEHETVETKGEEKPEAAGEPKREETLRPVRNTEHDLDLDSEDAEEEESDWDNWEEEEEELPTFFEALKPHLRRNQKGPGMSVAIDYLSKRWDQREADIVGALKECGFTIPETEEAEPEYFEFEGDLYWVNRNNRGQLFVNTREKPRPVFRVAQAKKLAADDPATAELAAERAAERAEIEKRKNERAERQAAHAAAQAAAAAAKESGPAVVDQDAPPAAEAEAPGGAAPAPLPSGADLLERIRPMMRRNRRGPGYSGSIGYLARALKHSEAELSAALAALGLNTPASPNDKPVNVEIGNGVYWLNKDSRGGIWINGREKREGGPKPEAASAPLAAAEAAPVAAESAPAGQAGAEPSPAPAVVPSMQSNEAPAQPAPGEPAGATAGSPEGTSSEVPSEPTATELPPVGPESKGEDANPAGVPSDPALAAVRPLLKSNRRGGGFSAELAVLSQALGKSEEELLQSLKMAGLSLSENADAKSETLEQAGELFWLSKTAEGAVVVNAKPAKPVRRGGRTRGPRKPKSEAGAPEGEAPAEDAQE